MSKKQKLQDYIEKVLNKLIDEKKFEMPWYNSLSEYNFIEAWEKGILTDKQVKKFTNKVVKAGKIEWNFGADESGEDKMLSVFLYNEDDQSSMSSFYEMYEQTHDTDFTVLKDLSESMECFWDVSDTTDEEMKTIIGLMSELNATFVQEEMEF